MMNSNRKAQSTNSKKMRPKNLNLFTMLLVTFQLSISSASKFQLVQDLMHSPLAKLILLGLAWSFFHHFFAGIRHLAMDVHWATTLIKARYTSKMVFVLGGLATLLLAISWVF